MSAQKYVAFLRAINVGGHTILKMADLKRMFQSFGLEHVQTFIQSGNVIFECEERDPAALEKRLESQLEKASGYEIRLFVRTLRELKALVSKSPFQAEGDQIAYVAFLGQKPEKERVEALRAFNSDADAFEVKGTQVYILRRDRERSVFSPNFLEKVLKQLVTTRNMTTLTKIVEKYK